MKIGNINQLMQGLMAYYTFNDGTAKDNVNSNNGRIIGNPQVVDGVEGKALEFNGNVNDYVKIDKVEGVTNKTLDEITLAGWVKFDRFPTGNYPSYKDIQQIIEGHTTNWEIWVETGGGAQTDNLRFDVNRDYIVSSTKLKTNIWYSFVASYDNSKHLMTLYLNGNPVAKKNVYSPVTITTGFTLARDYEAAIQPLYGAIDDIRIYNRALSQKEAVTYFDSTVPVKFPTSFPESSKLIISDDNDYHSPVVVKKDNLIIAGWKENRTDQLWLDLKAEANINGYQIKVGDIAYTVNLAAGERKRIFFEDVGTGDITVKIENKSPTAEIEKRSIIGYSTKTITFGDERATKVQIPVLDVTEKINIRFGKYERLMPNGKKIVVTVPAAVESKEVTPTEKPTTESINIENPGKPERPNKSDYIDPKTGELDREAYAAAKTKYREALKAYKTALKTYKAAVKAAKLEAKGEVKSLKVEEKAIKVVNKALTRLVKSEQRADKYVARAEITLEKANNYRSLAEKLRTEAEERAEALLGKDWTMEELKAKLVKPNKSDYIDPETGKLDKDAYASAVAEYKEARAIAKLFKKADKYALRADRLEAKAELYQQKALDISAKSVDKLKATLRNLVSRYSSRAESLKATGEALLKQAESLEGADYYKALGKGKYSVELAEGYGRGAEIATAVLETYVNVDVSVNPDVADSLESVDISNLSVNI